MRYKLFCIFILSLLFPNSDKYTLVVSFDGFRYDYINRVPTPNFDELLKTYPSCKLEASGEYVGLPSNQIGNSEVGHMNIGSGRVILQSLPRIDKAFIDNKVSQIDEFKSFFKNHNKDNAIHIIGLYSNGGVHSHANHIINICKLASKKCNNIKLHLFSDGRDTLPNEFGSIVDELTTNIPNLADILGVSPLVANKIKIQPKPAVNPDHRKGSPPFQPTATEANQGININVEKNSPTSATI